MLAAPVTSTAPPSLAEFLSKLQFSNLTLPLISTAPPAELALLLVKVQFIALPFLIKIIAPAHENTPLAALLTKLQFIALPVPLKQIAPPDPNNGSMQVLLSKLQFSTVPDSLKKTAPPENAALLLVKLQFITLLFALLK